MTTNSFTRPNRRSSLVAESLPDASDRSIPRTLTRPASHCADHRRVESHSRNVGATPCDRQDSDGAQLDIAVTQLNGSHSSRDSQTQPAAVELPSTALPDAILLAVDTFKATQELRKATANRIGAVVRQAELAGLPLPDIRFYETQLAAFESSEGKFSRHVERLMRNHPLASFAAERPGIGLVGLAWFLASVDAVSYNTAEGRARRGPAELWAYCGLAPGQKRRKGEKSNWSTRAKIAALQGLAAPCVYNRRSPYRAVYDTRKAATEGRLHSEPCAQCGKKGHPAPAGSPWKPGHRNADALKVMAKRILRDLFLEARRVGA